MNNFSLWLGIVVSLLTIGAMFVGAVAAIAKLWIRPLELQIQHVNQLLNKDIADLRDLVHALTNRVGQHTGNDAKHVPDGWRADLDQRLQRIEHSQVQILTELAKVRTE